MFSCCKKLRHITRASLLTLFFSLAQLSIAETRPVIGFTLLDNTAACGDPAMPGLADADFDTIPDQREGTSDYDNDGIPNYLDPDSDNDGLSDQLENGFLVWKEDRDFDGRPDRFDAEFQSAGNNCLQVYSEQNLPSELETNGQPDFLNNTHIAYTENTDPCLSAGGYYDRDKDYIPDIIEGNVDTDGDGIADFMDLDSDNDGLSDRIESGFRPYEPTFNADGDGYPDEVDLELYNRGVSCATLLIEPADTNNSGIADYLEPAVYAPYSHPCSIINAHIDTDGDHIPDFIETDQDFDGDNIPNFLDLDSDNDGLTDTLENLGFYFDIQLTRLNPADGFAYNIDDDRDGLSTLVDNDDTNRNQRCMTSHTLPVDTNNDGAPDYLDPDQDGDGLIDGNEVYYEGIRNTDADGDGLSDDQEVAIGSNPGSSDTDGGGVNDNWEVFQGADPTDNSDDAQVPPDLDSDNDGIPDTLEFGNVIDADGDQDGLSDAREAGYPDENNDGVIDDLTDINKNGIPDVAETGAPLPDFDQDGVWDFQDKDSDQDGVPDRYEHGWTKNSETQNYHFPDLSDDFLDTDSDGLINSHDLDSDGDGVFDFEETRPHFWQYGSMSHQYDEYVDSNADGRVDQMDDIDNNGIPDVVSTVFNPDRFDTDQDGIFNQADADHGETRYQYVYNSEYPVAGPVRDKDGDGIEDLLDPDPSNTGIFQYMDVSIDPVDSDGDGAWVWLDFDDTDPAIFRPPIAAAATELNTATQTVSDGGGGTIDLLLTLYAMLLVVSFKEVHSVRFRKLQVFKKGGGKH